MSELELFCYWARRNGPACFNTKLGLLLGQSQLILKQLELYKNSFLKEFDWPLFFYSQNERETHMPCKGPKLGMYSLPWGQEFGVPT